MRGAFILPPPKKNLLTPLPKNSRLDERYKCDFKKLQSANWLTANRPVSDRLNAVQA